MDVRDTTLNQPPPTPQVKVSELEGLFQLLRGDVEALFMQVGRSDLQGASARPPGARGNKASQRAASAWEACPVAPCHGGCPRFVTLACATWPPLPPQAPTVDLDSLGLQLGDAEALIDDQGSAVQVGAGRRQRFPDRHACARPAVTPACGHAASLGSYGWQHPP